LEIQTIWNEIISINFSETDFQQKWKPSAFFTAMQEVGSLHATHLGYDYKELFAANMSWVLSRVKIQFNAFPKVGEKIKIQTWPKGIHNKLFFMRDFRFLSAEGSQFAAATCAFVLINIKERRILPWRVLKGELPDNQGLSAIEQFPERLDLPENIQESFSVQARYSDVDLMGHVNNARYIEWITDSFPMQQFQTRQLEWLQINYLSEIKPAEIISICSEADKKDSSISYILGKNLTAGNTAFEAALKWGNTITSSH
jgi:medium-chain acyl-[acyl-carrier-protein] hydrolase